MLFLIRIQGRRGVFDHVFLGGLDVGETPTRRGSLLVSVTNLSKVVGSYAFLDRLGRHAWVFHSHFSVRMRWSRHGLFYLTCSSYVWTSCCCLRFWFCSVWCCSTGFDRVLLVRTCVKASRVNHHNFVQFSSIVSVRPCFVF